MKPITLTFIFTYILGHLMVALLGIHSWPFTDYPMFGSPRPKFQKISDMKLKAILHDGTSFWLPRGFSYSYGSFESSVERLRTPESKETLKQELHRVFFHRGGQYLNVREVHYYRRSLTRRFNSHQFDQNDELIDTISL